VPAQEFFFSLEFSSQGAPAALLNDLAAQVLGHVGCTGANLLALSDALQSAVAKGAAGGPRRCDVQFRVHGGTLEIVVTANGGRVWQTSLAIP
jgi:hypothetical protein